MRRGEPQQGLEKRGHRMMTTRPRAKNVPLLKGLHVLCQLHVLCLLREHTNPLFPMQRRPPWVLSRGRKVRTRISPCLRTRGRGGGAKPRIRRRVDPVRGKRVVPRRTQSQYFHRLTDAVTFAEMRLAGKHYFLMVRNSRCGRQCCDAIFVIPSEDGRNRFGESTTPSTELRPCTRSLAGEPFGLATRTLPERPPY